MTKTMSSAVLSGPFHGRGGRRCPCVLYGLALCHDNSGIPLSATPSIPSASAIPVRARARRRVSWFDWLISLLSEELAPNPRRLKSTLRMAVIGTVGAGLIASCHVYNQLGTYLVWLLIGPVAMLSLRKAVT